MYNVSLVSFESGPNPYIELVSDTNKISINSTVLLFKAQVVV